MKQRIIRLSLILTLAFSCMFMSACESKKEPEGFKKKGTFYAVRNSSFANIGKNNPETKKERHRKSGAAF